MSKPKAYPSGYIITENIDLQFNEFNPTLIVKLKNHSPQSWAIYPYNMEEHCYNKKTCRFDWEPQPSNRTDRYLKAHRFDTAEEAIEAAKRIIENGVLI